MGRYLMQASYTPAAWAAMVEQPEDRSVAVRRMVQNAGGHLECFYLAFGDHDVVTIVDLPDNESAAAVALIVNSAGGATVKTTVLLTPEQVDDAANRTVDYRPPGL